MMDDGRKYRKYTLMDDAWWMMEESTEPTESTKNYRNYREYTLMDDGWKYIK